MERLKHKLEKRKQEKNLRTLKLNEGLIDFYSNDYLGLARSRELFDKITIGASEICGLYNGSTGSRLLSGNSKFIVDLEENLSSIFKAEKCLIFNSGYNANLSILSSVPQKGDHIFLDEYIHASLKESARLSFASHYTFRHNDVLNLEKKLSRFQGEKFVVAESIYSMDGDLCPLEGLIEVCQKYNAHLILDEAHSTGIYGKAGNGLACELNIQDKIFARIHTFGKAMGVHGACIAGSEELIDYLVNFARPFIYTTALPPHSIISIKKAFEYVSNESHLQEKLKERIHFFTTLIKNKYSGLNTYLRKSTSPIQVLDVPGNENARRTATNIQAKGFDVRPILSPTVKSGEERLRICLHVYNSEREIENLVKALEEETEGKK